MKTLVKRACRVASISAIIALYSFSAAADDITDGCDNLNEIGLIPEPIAQHTLDLVNPNNDFKEARLALSYTGEPVSAGAWLLLFVDDAGPTPICYTIHAGEGEDLFGFNDVYISSTVVRFNQTTGKFEVFVPVSEYPFAGDEDHRVRMIEINFEDDGSPVLILPK